MIYGALLSSDPGDIHDTISNLLTDRIRVSIVGLAAQVAICAELCTRTNAGDPSTYAVALHEQHFRELFLAATTPPVTHSDPASDPQKQQKGDQPNGTTRAPATSTQSSLLMMGFPSRALAAKDGVSFCACHNRPTREGYACTRCRSKVCRLPAECPVCGLTLVLSTHLARSYHHLFPLRGWVEVPWSEAGKSAACFACMTPFPAVPKGKGAGAEGGEQSKMNGVSESGRYKCQVCGNHFCIDCDVYAHEMIHNCPGCQSDTRGVVAAAAANGEAGVNGGQDNGAGTEPMVLDS